MKGKQWTAAFLTLSLLAPAFAGCAGKEIPDPAPEEIVTDYTASGLGSASGAEGEPMSGAFVCAAADFGFSALNALKQSGNMMLSPVSLLYALGMTANGAKGDTKSQMENTLFGGIPVEEANRFFRGFADALPAGDNGVKLNLANSIWLNQMRGDFSVNAEFLSVNASYYDAGVFGLDFQRDNAVGQINRWTSEHTDGMIPNLLSDLSPDALMVLVNTVLFDGKWEQTYADYAVTTRPFTSYNGTSSEREMLSSTENAYFRLGSGTGFIRPYAEKYSFVGILPDEGTDIYEYAASVDGASFVDAVTHPTKDDVLVRIPSFTFEYGTEMQNALSALGMPDAFDGGKADFSGMGECGENIYIGRVIHKTKIELTREGTKAAGATAVIVETTAAMPTKEPVRVYLDRPFLFAIIENDTGLPVFCGIVSELE